MITVCALALLAHALPLRFPAQRELWRVVSRLADTPTLPRHFGSGGGARGRGGGGGGGGMGGIAIFLALLAHCPPHAACNLFAEGHSSSKNSRTAPPTSPGCRACSEVRVLTRPSSLLRSKRQAGSLARTASKRGQPERSASKPDRSQTSTTDRKR